MLALCIESSHARGLGHLYRSLTLATEIRARGIELTFLVNDHPSSVALLRANGWPVDVVDFDAPDWESLWLAHQPRTRMWINDRLDTTEAHAHVVREAGCKLVTFDDHGTGAAFADLHVAALAFDTSQHLGGRQVLRGERYLALDRNLAQFQRMRTGQGRLLVTLGGSDTRGVTPKVMQGLLGLQRPATIILGPAFNHDDAVQGILANAPDQFFTIKPNVPSLAQEMVNHELAITGGGTTPFQAAATGLPCVVIANEQFEIPVCQALQRLGCALFAGFHLDFDISMLKGGLPIAEMSRAGMAAIDLRGAGRVVDAIEALLHEVSA